MNMMTFDTSDARSAYWDMKREADTLRKQVERQAREITALKKTLDELRNRRQVFPDKYLPVIEPLISARPGVTLDDILRGGGSVGNREPYTLAELRRQCWKAVYHAFPEDSFVDIAKAFNRSHTSIWYAVKRGGWKR